jgi:hypothetical protein
MMTMMIMIIMMKKEKIRLILFSFSFFVKLIKKQTFKLLYKIKVELVQVAMK